MDTVVPEQLPEQYQGSLLVATFLDQDVEHLALVVDGAPQPHAPAADLADHLVEAPATGGRWPGAPEILGVEPAELQRPGADRLIADVDAAGGHQLLDVAQAEGEAEIQPHGLADHIRRKAVSLVGNGLHVSLGGRSVGPKGRVGLPGPASGGDSLPLA